MGLPRVSPGAGDEDLDRIVASLTDVEASPALQASIMRRIADERVGGPESAVRTFSRWHIGFAAAAVVLIAASTWLVLRPGTTPHSVSRQAPRQGESRSPLVASAPPELTARGGQTPADVERAQAPRIANARVRGTGRLPERSTGATTAAASVDDIALPPLAPPDPVLIAPLAIETLSVERVEIPPLQIDPVEGKPPTERGR